MHVLLIFMTDCCNQYEFVNTGTFAASLRFYSRENINFNYNHIF